MPAAVIGALRVNLGIDSAQFSRGLKEAQSGVARFGRVAKIGALAAATAFGAAAGALGKSVKTTIDAADDMSKAASKFGVPIEELSRLKYAADLSGVSFEGLGASVGRLSKSMAGAAKGTGAGSKAFADLGISVKNADGSLKSSSQVLSELADRFATMPDGAQKTALAMQLMGRSGADMIPLLNGGSAALAKLMAEADQFGQVFTQEMGASAELFNDNISRLQGAFGNLAAKIAQQLLPHLAAFTDWLVANAPKIAEYAGAFVEFSASVARGAVVVGDAVASMIAVFDRIDATIQGIGERNQARLVALGQMFVNLKDTAVQAMNAMVDGIIAAVTGRLNAVWDAAAAKVEGFKQKVRGLYDAVVGNSYIPDMVLGVEDWMGRLGTSFSSSIEGLIKGTTSWKEALVGLLKQLAGFALQKFGGGVFGGIAKSLIGGVTGGAGEMVPLSGAQRAAAPARVDLVVNASDLLDVRMVGAAGAVAATAIRANNKKMPGMLAAAQARGVGV